MRSAALLFRVLSLAGKILIPLVSILCLWYLAIFTSGMPAFVIPRPERVFAVFVEEYALIFEHLLSTLQVAVIGFILANVAGIGLAFLLNAAPFWRQVVMPAAITLRNIPYVALVTVLALAFGDSIASKVTIVALAGFFPVMVNTYQGLRAADNVVLDRMRVLNASSFSTFRHVRIPYALPYIVSAQEITGSSSIVVAIAAEWMISSTGLGYIINKAMQLYRGDHVYAIALLAALLSFGIYSVIHQIGKKLDWRVQDSGRGSGGQAAK